MGRFSQVRFGLVPNALISRWWSFPEIVSLLFDFWCGDCLALLRLGSSWDLWWFYVTLCYLDPEYAYPSAQDRLMWRSTFQNRIGIDGTAMRGLTLWVCLVQPSISASVLHRYEELEHCLRSSSLCSSWVFLRFLLDPCFSASRGWPDGCRWCEFRCSLFNRIILNTAKVGLPDLVN